MLENPPFGDDKVVECLEHAFNLHIAQFDIFPRGANVYTTVYRAVATDGTSYFVKLRGGVFNETTVELPAYLAAQGIREIIPPLHTTGGLLRADLDKYKVILYPFFEGEEAYELPLSADQWRVFGSAFQKIHTLALPPVLRQSIRHETYPTDTRADVIELVNTIDQANYPHDPVAQQGAAFLLSRRDEILALVARTAELEPRVQARQPKFVLCHSDMHAGNLLVQPSGTLFLVDWDDPILAPRERDLSFIGGGQGFIAPTPEQEEEMFYRGYGQTQLDWETLTYYRYARTLEDISHESEYVLSHPDKRQQANSLNYLQWEFLPNFQIDRAYAADRLLPK